MRRTAKALGGAGRLRGAQLGEHLRRFFEEGVHQLDDEVGAGSGLQLGEDGAVDGVHVSCSSLRRATCDA